jgi:hypothetical protein
VLVSSVLLLWYGAPLAAVLAGAALATGWTVFRYRS